MALFGFVFLVVACILIGIGIVVGLAACGIMAALVGLGVASSSLAIGLWSGKPALGLRAFLLQCGLFAGIPTGAVCAGLAHSLFEAYGSGWPVLVYGAIGGAFAGVLVAVLLDLAATGVRRWTLSRSVFRRQLE